MSNLDEHPERLPRVVYVLAAGTFLMGTTEFMIAGLLPDIADGMGVSEARSGLLITAFAVGMIIGSPVMALATRRLPPRSVLTLALLVFAAGHVVGALSASFAVLLASRVLTALATGAFWAVAAVVASRSVGPGGSARAIGVVIGGLTLANVIGVPIGTWAGQLAGWRGPFWALAVVSLGGAAAVGRLIPDLEREAVVPVRAELVALRNRDLWLALSACAFVMGGVLSAFSYISPLLTRHAGIAVGYVPLVLVGFGVGALAGTTIGGRLGGRRPLATAMTAAAAAAVVLLALATLSGTPAAAVVVVFLMGVTGFAVNPITTDLSVRFAGPAATLGASLSTSAFNAGIAGGSWVAGIALDSSLGSTGPALVGTAITAMTLLPLAALARRGAAPGVPGPFGRGLMRTFITGSADGLGRAAAKALLDEGHEVVVHVRSTARLAAVDDLVARGAAAVVGDLSDQEETRAVADQVNRLGRMEAVIHNAGVFTGPRIMPVNVVAPYLLTALVERPQRLVYLSSGMHRSGRDGLAATDWSGRRASGSYADSKLLVTAFAAAVTRLWPDVLVNAVDPGWVPTKMGGPGAPDDLRLGHLTQEWLATSDDAEACTSGGYWHHQRRAEPHPLVHDQAFQDRLLEALADVTGTSLGSR